MEEYSFTADIWSLGSCLVNMLTGERPFASAGASHVKVMYTVAMGAVPDLNKPGVSSLARDFLQLCLNTNPTAVQCRQTFVQARLTRRLQRPSAEELLQHPFVRDCGDPHSTR